MSFRTAAVAFDKQDRAFAAAAAAGIPLARVSRIRILELRPESARSGPCQSNRHHLLNAAAELVPADLAPRPAAAVPPISGKGLADGLSRATMA